jgi:hypothetical protein
MTLQEFNDRRVCYRRLVVLPSLVAVALVTASALLVPRFSALLAGAAILGVILAGIYYDNRLVSRIGLRCPSCRRHLHHIAGAVVTTRRCRCGAEVLDEKGEVA